jgi:hypothetical protein
MVIVTSMALWPTISRTTCGGVPSSRSKLTHVCRRSWKRAGGSPVAPRTLWLTTVGSCGRDRVSHHDRDAVSVPWVQLLVVFVAGVLLLSRWRGIGSLASLAFSLLVITVFALPALLDEQSQRLGTVENDELVLLPFRSRCEVAEQDFVAALDRRRLLPVSDPATCDEDDGRQAGQPRDHTYG